MSIFVNHLGQGIETENCEDGEVLGLDTDGSVICWDDGEGSAYNSGESLEQFGAHNLRENEIIRVTVSPSTPTK